MPLWGLRLSATERFPKDLHALEAFIEGECGEIGWGDHTKHDI